MSGPAATPSTDGDVPFASPSLPTASTSTTRGGSAGTSVSAEGPIRKKRKGAGGKAATGASKAVGSQAGADAEGSEGEPKPKRKRISYSCTSCAQRKAKCDRQRPCSLCVARGVGASCRYLVDGYDDPVDFLSEVRDRLDSMEGLLQQIAGAPLPPRRETPRSLPPYAQPPRRAGSESAVEPQSGFVSQGRYFGASASASVDDQGSLAALFKAPSAPREPLQAGVVPVPLELLKNLAPRPLCDFLVTTYFADINLTRYPIPEPTFRYVYSEMWTLSGQSTMPATTVHLLPLVFIVLAIAALTAPTNEMLGIPAASTGSSARQSLAHELFTLSCHAKALSDTTFEGRGDILMVAADLLKTRYLVLVRRASDAFEIFGQAVHRAYTLGLHRSRTGLPTGEEENRRRIWSYVLHLDRYLALLLGLPLTINEAVCDQPAPSNISDLDEETVLPPSTITASTFLILRHDLTKLMGRVVSEAFGSFSKPPYGVIVALEAALEDWASKLPDFFKLVPYGETHVVPSGPGGSATVLEVQRYLLATEYRFVRTSLHRPYLASSDPNMLLSQEAATSSALDDLWSRLTAYPLRGMDNLSTGSYRVTLSIVVLGVAMLLSPSTETAKKIHDCLLRFAAIGGQAESPGQSLVDEPTFREVARRELNHLKNRIVLSKAAQSEHASGDTTPLPPQGPPPPGSQLQPPTFPSPPVQAATSNAYSGQNHLNLFPPLPNQPTLDFSGFTPFSSFDFGGSIPEMGVGFGALPDEQNGAAGLGAGADINWDVFNDVLSSMAAADSMP